jgi:hypothetical protein
LWNWWVRSAYVHWKKPTANANNSNNNNAAGTLLKVQDHPDKIRPPAEADPLNKVINRAATEDPITAAEISENLKRVSLKFKVEGLSCHLH